MYMLRLLRGHFQTDMILQHCGSQWCRLMSRDIIRNFHTSSVPHRHTDTMADEKPPHGIESVLYERFIRRMDWRHR